MEGLSSLLGLRWNLLLPAPISVVEEAAAAVACGGDTVFVGVLCCAAAARLPEGVSEKGKRAGEEDLRSNVPFFDSSVGAVWGPVEVTFRMEEPRVRAATGSGGLPLRME